MATRRFTKEAEASPHVSKHILQRQLDNAWIHACGSDLPKVARSEIRQAIDGALTKIWIAELRMVERVEELPTKLDRMTLPYNRRLHDGYIEIELSRSVDNSGSAIAEERTASDARIGGSALSLP